jgi:hypothetical protein
LGLNLDTVMLCKGENRRRMIQDPETKDLAPIFGNSE